MAVGLGHQVRATDQLRRERVAAALGRRQVAGRPALGAAHVHLVGVVDHLVGVVAAEEAEGRRRKKKEKKEKQEKKEKKEKKGTLSSSKRENGPPLKGTSKDFLAALSFALNAALGLGALFDWGGLLVRT